MASRFADLLKQFEEVASSLIEKLKTKGKDSVGSGEQIASLTQQLVEKDRTIADLTKQLSEAKLDLAHEKMNDRQQQSDIAAAHVEAEKYQLQANVAEQQVEAATLQAESLRSAIQQTQQEKRSEREESERVETQLSDLLGKLKEAMEDPASETPPEQKSQEIPSEEYDSLQSKRDLAYTSIATTEPELEPSQPVEPVEGEPQLTPLVPGVDPMTDSESFVSKPLEDGVESAPLDTTLVEPEETQPIKPVSASKKRRG